MPKLLGRIAPTSTILAIALGLTAARLAAVDLPYQHLPVRLFTEQTVTNADGSFHSIDWSALGLSGYASPRMDQVRISRDGWMVVVAENEANGDHVVLRRNPSDGTWANLGAPSDSTATTAWTDDHDLDIAISPGGWVSLIYWSYPPACRLYGPSASAWSTPTTGGHNLIVSEFDHSQSTTPIGAAWKGDWAQPMSAVVISSYTYAPDTSTATDLSTSLPYNTSTLPQGIAVGRIYGNYLAGVGFIDLDPDEIFSPFTAQIGSSAAFNHPSMPAPPAVSGADWTGSTWEEQAISPAGVMWDIWDSTDNFAAAAYRAHGQTGAPTIVTPPVGYNSIRIEHGVDLTDGAFFVTVSNRDSNGDWLSGYDAKWTPGSGFTELAAGTVLTNTGADLPGGSAADGTWVARGWDYGLLISGAYIDESPVVWLPTPTVTVGIAGTATENGPNATATFTRTGSTLFPLSVKFTLSSTTDLQPDPDDVSNAASVYTVVIPRGMSSASVGLMAVDDLVVESSETVNLTLFDGMDEASVGNDRNAGLTAYNHTDTPSTVTVVSDDTSTNPQPTLSRSGSGIITGQISVSVVFSEAVTGFDATDLSLTGGGSVGTVSGSGTTYAFSYTPSGTGTASLMLPAATVAASDDAAANLVSNTLVIPFDTDAPVVGTPDLAPGSDLGLSSSDDLTADNNLTFTGITEALATVAVRIDGSTVATTMADAGGAWQATVPGLSNGVHAITAIATDAVGNASAPSTALSVTIDTTVTLAILGAPASPSGTGTPSWNGTCNNAATIVVSEEGNGLGNAVISGTTWSYTPTSALADGNHTLRFEAMNVAGAASIVTANTILIDTVGPVVTLSGTDLMAAGGESITLTATYADAGSGVSAITLADDDIVLSPIGAATAVVSGAGTATRTISLSGFTGDGTVTVQILSGTAIDGGALVATASNTVSITVDSTAPAVAFITAASTTGDTTPTIAGTAEIGATITLMEGATALGTAIATDGTWSITSTALAAGPHSLIANATDAAGNVGSTSGAIEVTIDLTPPAVAISTMAGWTNDATPTVQGSGEDGATVVLREGATELGAATIVGGIWSITSSTTLADGSHTLFARATDPYGNATDSSSIVVQVDTVAPTVSIGSPSDTLVRNGDTVTLLVTYADSASGLAEPTLAAGQVTVNGTGVSATPVVSGSGATRTITLTGFSGDGALTISLSAGSVVDVAGNADLGTSASATITVDNTAPIVAIATPTTITADSTPTVNGTCDDADATVELRDGSTVLGTSLVTAGTWSITPVATLAAGSYIVTARGTDTVGNIGSDSAGVSVTVNLSGPMVTISGGRVSGTTATFTATFSLPVTGFSAGDISIGGTAGGTKSVTITPDATNSIYTILISGLAAPSGTITVEVPADVATAVIGGDPSQGSNTGSVTFTVPSGSTADNSGGSDNSGCGVGGALGLLIAGLSIVGLRRRKLA